MKKILLLLMAAAIMCSCSKEEQAQAFNEPNSPKQNTVNVLPGMLTFDSYEDYEETRDYVNSLSEEEREEWFALHDEFVSFGREHDNMYFSLVDEYNLEEIDDQEVLMVVSDHNKYLRIFTDTVNNEVNLYIDKCEEADGNEDYYIMNEACVYAIADSVYRWYDTTLLIVPTSFYQTLMASNTTLEAETAATNQGVTIHKCFRDGPRGRDGVHYVGLGGTVVREGNRNYQIRIELFPRFKKHGMIDQYVIAKVSNVRKKVDARTWVLHRLNTQINHVRVRVTPGQMLASISPERTIEIFDNGSYQETIRSKKFRGWINSFPSDGFGYFSPNRFNVSLTGWNVYATNSMGSVINAAHNIQ